MFFGIIAVNKNTVIVGLQQCFSTCEAAYQASCISDIKFTLQFIIVAKLQLQSIAAK